MILFSNSEWLHITNFDLIFSAYIIVQYKYCLLLIKQWKYFNFYCITCISCYRNLHIVCYIYIHKYFTNISPNLKQTHLEKNWHSASRGNIVCCFKATSARVWINLCHLLAVRPRTIIFAFVSIFVKVKIMVIIIVAIIPTYMEVIRIKWVNIFKALRTL